MVFTKGGEEFRDDMKQAADLYYGVSNRDLRSIAYQCADH
jgi:hypothetical protein